MGTLVARIATLAPATLPAPSAFRRLSQWGLVMIAVALFALASAGSAFAEVTGAADNLRTGWYPDEPSLTPALLSGGSFQQVFKSALKGQIYAQPLTANGTLLVATEDNWVYGLDPNSGAVRWEKQFGTPVQSSEKSIECTDLEPHIGITGTPVIDTEHNIAYFVSNQYVSGNGPGPIAWYMHAVNLSSGEEVPNFPVKIEGKAQNLPGVSFEATQELQRPALLMMNGVVYAGFGSHCDHQPFEGWVMGVSSAGQLTTRWAASANGASIWQSGGGLISDGEGQILFSTGNGNGNPGEDPAPGPGSKPPSGLGQSVVRVAVQPAGGLKATDFFSPFENVTEDQEDLDIGSSAPIALPSPYFGTPSVPHLLVQSGKTGYVYLLNRDKLGGMGQGPSGTDKVLQRLGPYGGMWDGSAVWPGDGGYVYIPSVERLSDHLRFFKFGVEAGEPSLSLVATSPDSPAFGSGSPIITSNGTTSGSAILWTTWCPSTGCAGAELRAYNPVPTEGSPKPLWKASIGTAAKFSRPDASNGHVYVGNREGDLFGYSAPAGSASESPPTVVTVGQGVLPFQEHKAPVPDAELASRSLRVSPSGTLSVKVTCPTGESRCIGRVTLTLNAVSTARGRSKRRKPVILIVAAGSFKATGGKVTTVRLHLSAAGRALLARTHLLHARATIVAHDATGARHTSQTTVTIRAAKATHGRKG